MNIFQSVTPSNMDCFCLVSFNSYFELFVGFCFAYSISPFIQKITDSKLYNLGKYYGMLKDIQDGYSFIIKSTIEYIKELKKTEKPDSEFLALTEKINSHQIEYNNKLDNNKFFNFSKNNFFENFKYLYMLAGFYSLFIIIISGVEENFKHGNILFSLMIFNFIFLILILILYAKEFFAKQRDRKTSSSKILLICFVFPLLVFHVFFIFDLNFYEFNKGFVIWFSLMIPTLPFVLQLIKMFILKYHFKQIYNHEKERYDKTKDLSNQFNIGNLKNS